MTAVNDGLRLARSWEHRGIHRFQSLADELLNFGGRLSEFYQPHLLGFFFLTHLDPQRTPEGTPWRRELHASARAAIEEAIRKILGERLADSANPQVSDYFLDALKELRHAEARLRELNPKQP